MLKSLLSTVLAAVVLCCPALNAAEVGAKERTLSIVKPDAVGSNHIGDIVSRFEHAGLQVVGMKMLHLTQQQAEAFYAVHKERPFYKDLVQYMTSGPVVVMVLEGPDAVRANRDLMGATNPKTAQPGSIRSLYGTSIEENAVHGSDSAANAQNEIAFFFHGNETLNRTR
ncbi:MAG: nucleoside-diphosphate kinase [Chlamydiia bacterium]|nr:nucleoside-diphosphate kinase [Chlamydiia bacterium]